MNKNILFPDELIIDLSLTKEEIKKQLNDYEEACEKAHKELELETDK